MRVLAALLAVVLCVIIAHTNAEDDGDRQTSFNTLPGMSWLREMALGSNQAHSRKKRSLLLPKGSNMEVKWSLNLPFDTFSEYKAKVQFALPIKIPFPAAIVAAKRFDDSANYEYQEYQQQPYTIDNNDAEYYSRKRRQARQERSSIYNTLEGALEKSGSHGRHCLLRAICDVGEAPFDQGILGEILNALLTASVAGRAEDPSEDGQYDHYIEAELHGKLNGKCEQRYSKCKMSPFELLPQVLHTLHM